MAQNPSATRVLIADDEPGLREILTIAFRRQGYVVTAVPGVAAALREIIEAQSPFPLVLTDLVMPDGSGLDVLASAKKRSPGTEVILMTAHSAVETAVEAMRRGAYDFVVKPFSPAHLLAQAEKAIQHHTVVAENVKLKAQLERIHPKDIDFGTSPKMTALSELVSKVASTRTSVLITGESGTGKERIANLIHERSDRKSGPFKVVNCGALPDALMESELFGHEKGSFTGAASKAPGLFRDAAGGTIFLDEVGELPLPLQVKLLRVLQERKVRPVGGTSEIPVDVRVLAATNRDVEADVKAGLFRQDLYYRLAVIRMEMPPLRERREDVQRLADRFAKRFGEEHGKEIRGLTPDAIRALDRYDFPGNVRELENMMERAVALASGPSISLGDLPATVSGASALPATLVLTLPEEGCQIDEVLGEMERRFIFQALERTQGVRTSAAKLLGLSFRSLRYRLHKLGLETSDDTGDERDLSPDSSKR